MMINKQKLLLLIINLNQTKENIEKYQYLTDKRNWKQNKILIKNQDSITITA